MKGSNSQSCRWLDPPQKSAFPKQFGGLLLLNNIVVISSRAIRMDMPKSHHKGTSSFLVFSSWWWLALPLECCMQLRTMWRSSMCGHWYRISLAEVVEMFQLNSGTSKFIWQKSSEHSFSCKTAACLWLWWTSLVTSFVATKLRVKPYRILRWNSWIQRGQCCTIAVVSHSSTSTPKLRHVMNWICQTGQSGDFDEKISWYRKVSWTDAGQ